jgi:predicted nuclease with TOPRIM domain
MKTMQQLPNLGDIRSVRSIGAASIPRVKRPVHLDLYVLSMEKSRLEKELAALNKRRSTIMRKLADVDAQVEVLQKQVFGKKKNETSDEASQKPLKTLTINY